MACTYGVNQVDGSCLKHPRRRKLVRRRSPSGSFYFVKGRRRKKGRRIKRKARGKKCRLFGLIQLKSGATRPACFQYSGRSHIDPARRSSRWIMAAPLRTAAEMKQIRKAKRAAGRAEKKRRSLFDPAVASAYTAGGRGYGTGYQAWAAKQRPGIAKTRPRAAARTIRKK